MQYDVKEELLDHQLPTIDSDLDEKKEDLNIIQGMEFQEQVHKINHRSD